MQQYQAQDDILALELYWYFVRYQVWPTLGELQAMTIAYLDLIKGKGKKGKPLSIVTIPDFNLKGA
jgi:hypothetical protein